MPFRETVPLPVGRARIHRVDAIGCALPRGVVLRRPPSGWHLLTPQWQPNLVLFEAATIIGRLASGSPEYKIAAMYIEFENEADDSTPAVPPDVSRDADQGVAYYNALGTSPDRDYIRVPLIAVVLDSSNAVRYPAGNQDTFFAQTTGVTGIHGKPFSDTNNSRVFGAALVATPSWADATQDLVFSRFYLDADAQQVKLPSSQVGIEWEMQFQ